MGRLIYSAIASLDGDVEDADGSFSWAEPDEEVHRFVSTRRSRIERTFDAGAVRRLKAASGAGLAVGGAALAAEAFHAGLVDECHLFLAPVLVGGGKRVLRERRFDNGMVFLSYGAADAGGPS